MQSRIQGYMYNILSETDYQERILPATPPRAKTPPSPGPTAERQRPLPLIDARPSSSRGDEWTRVSSRFGDRAPAFRRGSRDLVRSHCPALTPCLPLTLHAMPVFTPLQFEADSTTSNGCWGHVRDELPPVSGRSGDPAPLFYQDSREQKPAVHHGCGIWTWQGWK